jgi:hypothetical protein
LQASTTDIITLGQTLNTLICTGVGVIDEPEQRFTSGKIIGGKFSNGPGQVSLGKVKEGNCGTSGM